MDYIDYIDDDFDDDYDDDFDIGTREVTVQGLDDDVHFTVGYGYTILDRAIDLAKKLGAYGPNCLEISCVVSGKELIEFIKENKSFCFRAEGLLKMIDENHKYELTAWDV